ncbi:MAG: phage replisome organizer N-terminal domain-containing protein [Campylobacterales bacterium]|nr:phage replisome organizer N-terminal domain-containing protein [Campylobacterales bacterium]
MSANKRYYWLKLKYDFFNDAKIKKLRRIAGGDTYTLILLKIMLYTLKDNGILIFEGIEATIAEELSLKLDENDKNIEATLIFMEKMGLIEEIDINKFSLPQVIQNTGSETSEAVKKRNQRLKKDKVGTLSPKCPQSVPTEKEKEKEIEKDLSPISSLNIDFYKFLDEMREKYKGNSSIEFYPTLYKSENGEVKVSQQGYLYIPNKPDFTTSQATKIWEYLYQHQDKIEHIEPQIWQHRQEKRK